MYSFIWCLYRYIIHMFTCLLILLTHLPTPLRPSTSTIYTTTPSYPARSDCDVIATAPSAPSLPSSQSSFPPTWPPAWKFSCVVWRARSKGRGKAPWKCHVKGQSIVELCGPQTYIIPKLRLLRSIRLLSYLYKDFRNLQWMRGGATWNKNFFDDFPSMLLKE